MGRPLSTQMLIIFTDRLCLQVLRQYTPSSSHPQPEPASTPSGHGAAYVAQLPLDRSDGHPCSHGHVPSVSPASRLPRLMRSPLPLLLRGVAHADLFLPFSLLKDHFDTFTPASGPRYVSVPSRIILTRLDAAGTLTRLLPLLFLPSLLPQVYETLTSEFLQPRLQTLQLTVLDLSSRPDKNPGGNGIVRPVSLLVETRRSSKLNSPLLLLLLLRRLSLARLERLSFSDFTSTARSGSCRSGSAPCGNGCGGRW